MRGIESERTFVIQHGPAWFFQPIPSVPEIVKKVCAVLAAPDEGLVFVSRFRVITGSIGLVAFFKSGRVSARRVEWPHAKQDTCNEKENRFVSAKNAPRPVCHP